MLHAKPIALSDPWANYDIGIKIEAVIERIG